MPVARTIPGRRLAACAALALLTFTPPAPAQANVRREMAAVAGTVHELLKGYGETKLTVGPMQCSKDQRDALRANAGPGLGHVLIEELARLGLEIGPKARFEFKATYDCVQNEKGQLQVGLTCWVEDTKNNKKVLKVPASFIDGEEALAGVLGLTVALPPNATEGQRTQRVLDSTDDQKTTAEVRDRRIRASKDSPYAVEVLVKQSSGPPAAREARLDNGFPFVPVARQEAYVVRLHNDAAHEAAVTLTIDGINAFAFAGLKDANRRPLYPAFVVPPKSSLDVAGWPTDLAKGQTDEFLVTAYAKSAAAELKSEGGVGVITACFAASWPTNGKPPEDEPRFGARPLDATGRGLTFEKKYDQVARNFGVLRAAVSVRYTK